MEDEIPALSAKHVKPIVQVILDNLIYGSINYQDYTPRYPKEDVFFKGLQPGRTNENALHTLKKYVKNTPGKGELSRIIQHSDLEPGVYPFYHH